MTTLALQIEYDGTNYGGWQIQKNFPSIQSEIEKAIETVSGTSLNLIAAGRTDAGVHARGQVAHAVLDETFPIPVNKISLAINANLPSDVRIKSAALTENFHARYDAIAREYSYYIHIKESVFLQRFSSLIKYPFNADLLQKSAEIFLGRHDFTTFSKINPSTKNYICEVLVCEWKKISAIQQCLIIKANRFVYGMVRAVVGAMLDAARGKRTIEDLRNSLASGDRKFISPLAPPQGLILEKIYYPEKFNFF